MVCYCIVVGKFLDIGYWVEGLVFGIGEFFWGINSGWLLFGGVMSGENEY